MSKVLCRQCQGTGEGDDDLAPICRDCGGLGEVEGCSVEGCPREGAQMCELCKQIVCVPHARVNVAAEMILCSSCDIGMGEGLGAAMQGW